jgi:hypothetical protein
MRRLFFLVTIAVILLSSLVSVAQIPNPRGFEYTVTTVSSDDNSYTISVRQLSGSNKVIPCSFLSGLTVSDSCRIVIENNSLVDDRIKSDYLAQTSGADDYTEKHIPLASGQIYNFACNTEEITLYVYGSGRNVTITGASEYE